MTKLHNHKNGHLDFLRLSEVLHHMEGTVVVAYDWLAGPALTEKQRTEHRLAENEPIRRVGTMGL